ncbi:MAG TPA: alpha/beta hydrolase [Candidatus Limnocylindrales bacterium]|nr:alpha/beta hydrolase [Candidatus Limnocylindrales bacterium]
MAELDVDGLRIHYLTEGAGPPLVMLHGATSSGGEDWAAQRPAFRRAFHLLIPDARSHAGTRWDPSEGFSTELLVHDLEGFVDGLGLRTFHLVGFSMGGMTALTYATRHPERLRTLLISGIDNQPQPRSAVAARLMDPERVDRDEPAWAAQLERRHGPVQGPGAWRRLLRALASDVGAQAILSPAVLRGIRVPTLLAYGDRDVFCPPDHAVALYRSLPQARLFMAPDCDHQVMVSRPGLFNEAAAAFYRETAQEAEARAAGRSTGGPRITRSAARAPIPTELHDLPVTPTETPTRPDGG